MHRYDPPANSLFIRNRANFIAKMKPGHAAIFWSNTQIASNADAHYDFQQNSNMYYLSGLDQEECILFLFPDAPKEEFREVLFIRKTSEEIQTWEGWKYSHKEAEAASGISEIRYFEEFDGFFRRMRMRCEGIYLDFNEHEGYSNHGPSHAAKFARELHENFPGHSIQRAAPILTALRSIKGPEEIKQLKAACDITGMAFDRVLKFVGPGVKEYEIEAEIQHEFLRNRATRPAYQSIIASGKNACVLHYILNSAQCKDGDLLLMDFGAKYGNYSADLTRTIPVNGKFSPRQREVYNACLSVFKAGRKMMVPGISLDNYHKEVAKIMTEELLGIGLLDQATVRNEDPNRPAYKKYFMHGTSHFLGLDTHDVGNRYAPFEVGMVLTCEPGIYIPEEGIGVRIESDIWISEDGPVDLMEKVVLEVDEIEARMGGGN